MRFNTGQRTAIAVRGEYFNDRAGIIVNGGLETTSASANFDFAATAGSLLRFEVRYFSNTEQPALTASASISF